MSIPKILIVEDEQVVAMDVESQLTELGYEVVGVATTGGEAMDLVEETRPDLVLMDIQLHRSVDGIEVARRMLDRWQIQVVFVTAYTKREVTAHVEATERYGYLTKPYTTKDLSNTIEAALERPARG